MYILCTRYIQNINIQTLRYFKNFNNFKLKILKNTLISCNLERWRTQGSFVQDSRSFRELFGSKIDYIIVKAQTLRHHQVRKSVLANKNVIVTSLLPHRHITDVLPSYLGRNFREILQLDRRALPTTTHRLVYRRCWWRHLRRYTGDVTGERTRRNNMEKWGSGNWRSTLADGKFIRLSWFVIVDDVALTNCTVHVRHFVKLARI